MVRINQVLVLSGLAGASVTLFLGFLWAPSVSSEAFKSPLAQKIFYWHVPSAWAAMLAFTMLFIGSTAWFFSRKDWGWNLHVASAESGLVFGLMAVWSGCVWGAAEWGTPWDWEDWRLNTFGLLTLLALFLVLGRQSQPDGVETRDTFSTFGLYGFILVPLTYVATRIWVIRHPGPVIAGDEDSSISGDMALVLMIGAISFTTLIVGHILTSMEITKFEQRLERLQKELDGE